MSNKDTGERLAKARDAYNAHWRDHAGPMLGISEEEKDKLSCAELARRINDPTVRHTHVRLAIEMLNANIADSRPDATLRPLPTRSPVVPVVGALVTAAFAYGIAGPVSALLGAALGYWVGHSIADRSMKMELQEVEAHNEMVPEWKETVEAWERSVAELRELVAS